MMPKQSLNGGDMNKTLATLSLSLFAVLIIAGIALLANTTGCGSDCGGTIFVNWSGSTVTVSAHSLSGISFSTFTLEDDAEKKICGDDENDIMGTYTWANGDTYDKGMTWSGGDFCMYILSDHTAETDNCI